jgi:hypothetical protein
MCAATHAGDAPEGVGGDAEVCRSGRGRRIEWRAVVPGPRRHDERAVGPERGPESSYQACWSAFDRAHGAKRGMDEKHTACLDAEVTELVDEFFDGRHAIAV